MPKRALVLCAILAVAANAHAQPVGSEVRANAFTSASVRYPAVASSADNFVVVWQLQGDVFGRRFSTAALPVPTRSNDFRVNSFITGAQSYPAVAMDATGNFVVVYQSSIASVETDVNGQRFSSAGTRLGAEFRVNTFTSLVATYASFSRPAVSSDPSGNFVVVWANPLGGGALGGAYEIRGQRYGGTGDVLGGNFRVNSGTTYYGLGRPSVSSASDGSFVVVWDASGGFGSVDPDVWARRFDASGAPVGDDFRVNSYTTSRQQNPSVASSSSGEFAVVWASKDQEAAGYHVFARRYTAGGAAIGTEFRVDTATAVSDTKPRVASDASGNLTVVWKGFDASDWGILGRRYLASGASLGSVFQVNSYTPLSQADPAVTASGTGFVVVWSGPGVPGYSFTCIFLKRYPGQGDVNGDGVADVADVFYLINFLFASGPAPVGPGDANGDGNVDVADVFYLINFLFASGPAPL
jgi:hypothetical protein